MNSTLPIICGTLLTAMVGAGLSHYWSVQTIVAIAPINQNAETQFVAAPPFSPDPTKKNLHAFSKDSKFPDTIVKSQSQEAFFNELLAELKHLKNENRDLRDLMGETNRDVMKLAFRVDTHSESFRPLPTSEQRDDNTFNFPDDSLPGVLPPRAMPVPGFDE